MNIKLPPVTGRKPNRRTRGRRREDVWPALTRVLVNLATLISVVTSGILYWLNGQHAADQAAASQALAQKIEIEALRKQLEELKRPVEAQ